MAQHTQLQINGQTQYIDNEHEDLKQIVPTTKVNNPHEADIQCNRFILGPQTEPPTTHPILPMTSANTPIPQPIGMINHSLPSTNNSTANTTNLNASAASFTPKGYKSKPSLKCKVMDTITEQKESYSPHSDILSVESPFLKSLQINNCHGTSGQHNTNKSFKTVTLTQCSNNNTPNKLKGSVSVSREFTQNIIPEAIAEELHDIYGFMDKSMGFGENKTAFNYGGSTDTILVIINFGFHDKKSQEPLFCVISKQFWGNRKWFMANTLYTAQDIMKGFVISKDKLPLPITTQVDDNDILQTIDNNIIANAFAKTKWGKIHIHSQKKNKKRKVLHMTSKEFIDTLKQNYINNIKTIPIISVHNANQVENVMIVHLTEDRSIGISYKSESTNTIKITGIHLDKKELLTSHQLVSLSHRYKCNCLHNFKSKIDELKIGNVYEEQNQINALKKANNELRKENKSPVIKYIKGVLDDAGDIITKNTKIALSAIKQIFNVNAIKEAIDKFIKITRSHAMGRSVPISNDTNIPMPHAKTVCGFTTPFSSLSSIT